MEARQVYEALRQLREGNVPTIDEKARDYLTERQLILTRTHAEYQQMQTDASRYDQVRKDLNESTSRQDTITRAYWDLKDKTESFFHWLFTSRAKLNQEKDELQKLGNENRQLQGVVSQLWSEKSKLSRSAEHIQRTPYVQTPQGYLVPTNLGIRAITMLQPNLDKLGTTGYDEFTRQVNVSVNHARQSRQRITGGQRLQTESGFSIDDAVIAIIAIDLIEREQQTYSSSTSDNGGFDSSGSDGYDSSYDD